MMIAKATMKQRTSPTTTRASNTAHNSITWSFARGMAGNRQFGGGALEIVSYPAMTFSVMHTTNFPLLSPPPYFIIKLHQHHPAKTGPDSSDDYDENSKMFWFSGKSFVHFVLCIYFVQSKNIKQLRRCTTQKQHISRRSCIRCSFDAENPTGVQFGQSSFTIFSIFSSSIHCSMIGSC